MLWSKLSSAEEWILWRILFQRTHAVRLFQQRLHNTQPFPLERLTTNRFSRAPIPVCRIPLIAFLAMQIRVHPRALSPFVSLRRFVRPCPVAFAIPPQPRECQRKPRRRRGIL